MGEKLYRLSPKTRARDGDRSVKAQLNAEQRTAQGGRFTDLTQWMLHAWIWKDSPKGVFSDTNPNVR